MKTFEPKTLDEVIQSHVDWHVEQCKNRERNGFKVNEVDVPSEFASKVFNKLNDEITIGGRLPGWQFGVFNSGEFKGKTAMLFVRDEIEYKKYFLKYSL